MSNLPSDQLLQMETTCGSLLYELQIIWNEMGESDVERDKMLLELEQECLEVYRRKVDQANKARAQLRQAIADSEAELASICSAMGERPVHIRQSDQNVGSLREELETIVPQLEEMRKKKCDTLNQFLEVLDQIQKISKEIFGPAWYNPSMMVSDESDLSIRKLEELHRQLQALQQEKSNRVRQVLEHLNTLNCLCLVLGMDFKHTIGEVHSSLDGSEESKNITNETIERLAATIKSLREVKIQRMQKLQDLATTMLELWNLMDTPVEEQQMFQNVTCNIAASEHEITEPGTLSLDFISYVEAEVLRLEELKASKMKELVLKKRSELEEICRRTHLVAAADTAMEYAIQAIETGAVDPCCILEQIEAQIAKVKEEAFSRKEILEKVEKWLAACEEECWLEEYNRDENRYNAGRGAHLTLKRAEKARAAVTKLPAIVEALVSKTIAWQKENGTEFTYDGIRLLSMLEEYNILRQEKEQERRRQRDQKRLQGQLIAEQEALFGSKPSPSKAPSAKKVSRPSTGNVNKRLSLGGAMLQNPKFDLQSTKSTHAPAVASRSARKGDHHEHDDGFTALSSGKRGFDIAGIPVNNNSFNGANAREIVPTVQRKPFSPILSHSSKANTANLVEDSNFSRDRISLKTVPINNTPQITPLKRTFVSEEENMTPKVMPIPVAITPSTVSVPMQTAPTPASACVLFGATAIEAPEDIEYSFEERRAGFILPKSHRKVHI
ncbi:65-kDa microtubule-associated protein 3-like [Tasmannia lanceolata]|uniref:65-kDa microtubule-associated protein 3-like n=1 Tax=Tasmannia lanceolata TaxID=3420 RepID=UPI004064B5FB